jgi:4-hydroxybenzoate polyprenyltransferase
MASNSARGIALTPSGLRRVVCDCRGPGWLERLEGIQMPGLGIFTYVLAISTVRFLLEDALNSYGVDGVARLSIWIDQCGFYLLVLGLFLLVQKLLLGRAAAVPIMIGLLFALLPPIVDAALGRTPRYSYVEPTLFFTHPGLPVGELIAIYAAILTFGVYVALSKGNLVYFVPGIAAAWVVGQIVGSVHPYWIVLPVSDALTASATKQFVTPLSVIYSTAFVTKAMIALAALAVIDEQFGAFVRYRFSRVLLGLSLCMLSASIFRPGAEAALLLTAIAVVSTLLAFMINTKGDEEEDRANGRPEFHPSLLTWSYAAFFLLSFLLIAYRLDIPWHGAAAVVPLAWLYGAPFHLKRVFPFAYVIEGVALSGIFGSFALATGAGSADVMWTLVTCFVVFAFGSIVKDYKDVEGDRAAGVPTVFTMLGTHSEQFWAVFRVFLVIGPVGFMLIESPRIGPSQYAVHALFAPLAAAVLCRTEWEKERLVNVYLVVFSLWQLANAAANLY